MFGVGVMEENKLDINDQAEWLKQIKLTSLSNRALTLASKLAHGIRKINGNVVRLQDQEMALHLAKEVVQIDDEKLNSLYRSFLEEATKVDEREFQAEKPRKKAREINYRGVKARLE